MDARTEQVSIEEHPCDHVGPLDASKSFEEVLATTATIHARKEPKLLTFVPLWFTKLLKWLRGPGKEVTLPHPQPWLHFTVHYKNSTRSYPVESLILKATRHFASPILLALSIVVYIISLSFLARAQWYQTPADVFADCTSSFWKQDAGCGLNGQSCQPFNSSIPIEFRCPAGCPSVILANNYAVGAEEARYVPLVVGGGGNQQVYRGDSWVCVAAVQAGMISARTGGCGALDLIGEYTDFISTSRNGVNSIDFPSSFPSSFRFTESNTAFTHCTDLRDNALVFNVLVTVFLFLILRPTPLVLFWSLVCIGFWHITFFSDARAAPAPISDAFGVFLPTLFVSYVFWLTAFRFVLPTFSNLPLERAVYYLAAFWPGALINVTASKIPIDRLLRRDIAERPGAVVALIIIAIVLLFIILNQLRVIRKTGLLLDYLMYYVIGGLVILVLSQLPTLTFRLHHYVFAMLLIPLTAFPTRISAILQAFFLGVFLDGVSRWGFASILQSTAELQRDGPLGTALPSFTANLTDSTVFSLNSSSLFLTWDAITGSLSSSDGWNGFSVIIDDVERYTGSATSYNLSQSLDWSIMHFFRLAFQKDGVSGDYTRAGTIFANGTWIPPLSGPS